MSVQYPARGENGYVYILLVNWPLYSQCQAAACQLLGIVYSQGCLEWRLFLFPAFYFFPEEEPFEPQQDNNQKGNNVEDGTVSTIVDGFD